MSASLGVIVLLEMYKVGGIAFSFYFERLIPVYIYITYLCEYMYNVYIRDGKGGAPFTETAYRVKYFKLISKEN